MEILNISKCHKSEQKSQGSKRKQYFELIENENMTYQNLGKEATAVLSGTFIALNAQSRKEERHQSDSSFWLTKVGAESQLSTKKVEAKKLYRSRQKPMK